MKGSTIILVGLLWIAVGNAYAEPQTYEECILTFMKGVGNNVAAARIGEACHTMFKMQQPKNARSLTPEEMKHLTGWARFSSEDSIFTGEIHNGNATLTISSITFRITTIRNGERAARLYREAIHIIPLTVESFRVRIMAGKPYTEQSWSIASAKGY